jgi:tryptophan synthase alpha chain
VGFGIADRAGAAALAPVADGVVIGTAFQNTIEAHRTSPDLVRRIETQVREFKAALAAPPRRPSLT